MCGICGIINFNGKPANDSPVRKMMKVMKHRGPNDEGIFVDDNVALGFIRLSILDLSMAGHQPMVGGKNNISSTTTSNDRYTLIFNGEIFNYIELRNELSNLGHTFKTATDTEVLFAAYIEWGEACLNKFNGMWAFVIYDRIEKSVFISRDRYGIKPLYYYYNNDSFIFASEIPPILANFDKNPEANQKSLFEFFAFNRTDQTENTFFQGIKKLQHGHNLKFSTLYQENQSTYFTPLKWYDLRSNLKTPIKSPEEFFQYFSESIKLRLRSDVPVGVCLSGGIDSSSIVSTILKYFDIKDLNTFSAVYNKGQTGDESEYISEYSKELERMHYTTPTANSLFSDLFEFIKIHAEPIPTTSIYAQYKVMELAQKHVVVTLDGQGADEMLAGYHYFFGYFFKDLLLKGNMKLLVKEIFAYYKTHKSLFGIKSFAYFMLPEFLRTKTRVKKVGYLTKEFLQNNKYKNSIAGELYGSIDTHEALLNHFEFKLEHLLKWEDRNSMRFSIEARVPFLDHNLVERVLAMPSETIIKNGMTKLPLRDSMEGIIPEKIRMRKDKIGFSTPQDEWFKEKIFQELVTSILDSDSFRNRNIINPDKAIKLYKKHLNGKINISNEIWKWIHVELWFREFID